MSSQPERITLQAVMSSHEDAMNFLVRHAKAAGLSARAEGKLRLAADEIVTNVIMHGYAEHHLSGDMSLEALITPESFTLTVEDAAPPFDPRNRPVPESLNQSLEMRPIGGVGLHLVMKSVDAFHYEYVDGKNRNVLTMKRDQP